jgi:hypothetical protein
MTVKNQVPVGNGVLVESRFLLPQGQTGLLPGVYKRVLALLFCFFSIGSGFYANIANALELKVAEPFLELHTGPGAGYPIAFVVLKNQLIDVHLQRTDWYKVRYQVRADQLREGWVHRDQLTLTITPVDQTIRMDDAGQQDFTNRRWELGVLAGELGGISSNSVYFGYAFNPYNSTEVWFEDILGDFSSSKMLSLDVVHQPFPEWLVSPFFSLGVGIIKTDPRATLVKTQDREDDVLHMGLGLRMYLNQHFLIRAEYKSYVMLTTRDENEEPEAWKLGFSVFY